MKTVLKIINEYKLTETLGFINETHCDMGRSDEN
jgi:hypothetical protein